MKLYIVCAANRYIMSHGSSDIIVAGARHHDKIMNGILKVLQDI